MRINLLLYALYSTILLGAIALKGYQPTNRDKSREAVPPVQQVVFDGLDYAKELALVTTAGSFIVPADGGTPNLQTYSADGHRLGDIQNFEFRCATKSGKILGVSNLSLMQVTLTGQVLWRKQVPWAPYRAVCTESRAYFVDFRTLTAISSEGELLWVWDTPAHHDPSDNVDWVSLDADGTIYTGSVHGELAAVSPSGTPIWQTYSMVSPASRPVPDGKGRVYRTDLGNLFAIDGKTGATLWQYKIYVEPGAAWDSAPALAPDGRICFARRSLFCVNANGEAVWRFDPDTAQEKFVAPPIFDSSGSAYLYSQGAPARVYAISATGSKKWAYEVSGTGVESEPMGFGPDGALWKATAHGFLAFQIKH
jgi:outer membrane protein assembly factor BamB